MELSQGPEEEASKEFVRANLSIQIHSIIHKAQKSHGLVSNDTSSDFTSYRSYLTNRISRLRHSKPVHKRTSGHGGKKHAYRKKEYSIEDANQHENFILIPLAIAERAWAHAMEIKNINQMTMQSGGKKNYYVKRLKKAVKHVAELEYYVNEICDENTMLETKCYAAFIRGTFYCESKDWKNACRDFATAFKLCHELSKVYRSKEHRKLDQSDYFFSRGNYTIQPLLRYCSYELQKDSSIPKEEVEDILNLEKEVTKTSCTDVNVEEKDTLTTNKSMTISFRGKKLVLNDISPNIQMAFFNAQNKKRALRGLAENTRESVKDAKLMALLISYDHVIKILEDVFDEISRMASGPEVLKQKEQYSDLLGYCKYEKLKMVMERNESIVYDLRKKDIGSVINANDGGMKGPGQQDDETRLKIVEEIARFYDILLKDAKLASELTVAYGDDYHEDELVWETRASVLRFRAFRCFYIGRIYAMENVGKFQEALALFEQSSMLTNDAVEEITACDDMENKDTVIAELLDLHYDLTVFTCRTKASLYLMKNGSGLSSGLPLLRRLDDFDAGGKTCKLAAPSPMLEPIVAKPFFIDIAKKYVNNIEVECIDEYLNATTQKKQGLFSFLG